MIVRPATDADLAAIREVGFATWPATYAFAGEDDNGQVIGVGNISTRPPIPITWKLYVRPDAQGCGAGTALIRGLIVYAARGFVEVGRERATQARWPQLIWVERPAC